MSLNPGTVLGDRFEIIGVLGQGGMATVYFADDRVRGEQVALKVLHPHLASQAGSRRRLQREVRAAARVRHPHALVAHELHAFDDGTLAISLPLHRGTTLAEHVAAQGPLSAPVLTRLADDLAGALGQAHRSGVVHRDVSPNNVMLDDQGVGVLSDFGLARLDAQQTATGTAALGTAGYAAPEVYQGVRTDPRSDLYGLGATLYLAATGSGPFAAPTPVATLQAQLAGQAQPLAELRPDLPAAFCHTIDALLTPRPEDRLPSAAAVQAALQTGPPTPQAQVSGPGLPSARPVEAALPTGAWRVRVRERSDDRQRRRRLRRGAADNLLEAGIEKVVGSIQDTVSDWLGVDRTSPEQRLVRAVARAAELPDDALRELDVLQDRRFYLVEGVDEDSARQLASEAAAAGFRAQAERARAPTRRWLFPLFFGLPTAMALFSTLTSVDLPWLPLLVLGVVISGALNRGSKRRDYRTAYTSDLSLALSAGYSAQQAPSLASAQAAPPPLSLADRVRGEIDALEQGVQQADLAAFVAGDLQATVRELRAQVDSAESWERGLREELARSDLGELEAEVQRVGTRLERLRTLSRGDGAQMAEISSLERALGAHQQALDQAAQLEGELTQATARLLELSATATHARRTILQQRSHDSATEVLGRLQREARAAADAKQELRRQRARVRG